MTQREKKELKRLHILWATRRASMTQMRRAMELDRLARKDSPRNGGGMPKNLQAKTRSANDPYEVWQSFDGSWTWKVLKKWQADDDKPYARWFCQVITPIVPGGEMGDVYVAEIKRAATRVA